jgi:hypothetical protein
MELDTKQSVTDTKWRCVKYVIVNEGLKFFFAFGIVLITREKYHTQDKFVK